MLLPEIVSALVLLENHCAEQSLNQPIVDAVISVPAKFNNAQRKATIDAASLAGITVKKLINEPTAAAFAYGMLERDLKNKWALVFDWGGGTLDVSVLHIDGPRCKVHAVDGDMHLGGEDIDNNLAAYQYVAKHMETKYNRDVHTNSKLMHRLRLATEKAKVTLSSHPDAVVVVQDTESDKLLQVEVTREQLTVVVQPLLARAMQPTNAVLKAVYYRPKSKRDRHPASSRWHISDPSGD